MTYRLNLELLVDENTLFSVKEYGINIPEVCIGALLEEIDRQQSVRQVTTLRTPQRENEELRAALRRMRIEKESLMEKMMMVAR